MPGCEKENLLNSHDAEETKHITRDFIGCAFRADRHDVLGQSAQGAGLGLLGMQERVQFAGGHLKINSIPNRGTIIEVYLPVASSGTDQKSWKEVTS